MIADRFTPILYSCVAVDSTVLAENVTLTAVAGAAADFSALLAAGPRFHRHYSHVAGGRIYSFLFSDRFLFFAVADESVGKTKILAFLAGIRDAFLSSVADRRRSSLFTTLCFQDEFSPQLQRLAISAGSQPPDTPFRMVIEERNSMKKGRREKESTEIAMFDGDIENSGFPGRSRSAIRVWSQNVRTIVLCDLLFCCLLFGIWLSVCRGFQCVEN